MLQADDPDAAYFREISNRYTSNDFIVVTYTPTGNLFSDRSLDRLARLRDDLTAVDGVRQVNTLLDVPLLRNPPVGLSQVKGNVKSLEHPDADLSLAIQEFRSSPIYEDLLISRDLSSTAVQVTFSRDTSTADRRTSLAQIRTIVDAHRGEVRLHIGGVPMIVDDIMGFIRSDLMVFGLGVWPRYLLSR